MSTILDRVGQNDQVCMLSIDVEDWFQVERFESVISRDDWGSKEFRVESNVEKILSLFNKHNTRATFFILGWIAERIPGLVHKIKSAGHEIASHGYGHKVAFQMGKNDLEEDISKSKKILEDLLGEPVIGYRAPSFSIIKIIPKVLKDYGFHYDSSLFPSSFSSRYGKIENMGQIKKDSSVLRFDNGLLEVPVSTLNILGKHFPWGGGGYFRFYPTWLFMMGIRLFLRQQNGYLFYGHPWDLDPSQPRVEDISWMDRFLHYSFLTQVETKLEKLISNFHFVPIKEGLERMKLL